MTETPTCADCGRPIKRHPAGGRWIHSSGGAVAACDLDSDHEPRPEVDEAGIEPPSDVPRTDPR